MLKAVLLSRHVFLLLLLFMPTHLKGAEAIIANHSVVAQFDLIPQSVIEAIEASYNIYYAHTSHGYQIMTGLEIVHGENDIYDIPIFYQEGDDLGGYGDTTWVPATRSYLSSNPQCNMAMFSWCGGVSDNTEEGINIYLAKMEELEADYPGVKFIYMTGHLDGSGPSGNLYIRNNQIRGYCLNHNKILFDFADIESYDPDGVYYPDESDYCYWCYDWCNSHPCPDCGDCAHSHCFNCYQKGKAWWWMMARINGWMSASDTCGDANGDGVANVSDAVYIINYVFTGGNPPNPYKFGDANCDSSVNVSDAVWIINYVFAGGHKPCDTDGDNQPDC